MWLRALLAGVFFTGVLGACAVIDPVDSRYDTVSRSLAKARNEAIFLNLIRASHDYPLSFTTIANVTPTMTNTSAFALPSFSVGPPNCLLTIPAAGAASHACSYTTGIPGNAVGFGNTTASNATAIGTNFNVSTQETGAFYNGFLKPIDLQILDYFIRQGYPRELLFWLFTDSFQITSPRGQLGYHYNPPDDYGCSKVDPKHRCFQDWVQDATLTGLTVEQQTQQKESGGTGGGGKPDESRGGQAGRTTTWVYTRFCFNPVLAGQAQALVTKEQIRERQNDLDVSLPELYKSDLTCGSPDWKPADTAGTPQSDILPLLFRKRALQFAIVPRSAYGVFEFLGNLMRMEREHIEPSAYAYIPPGRSDVTEPPILWTVHEDERLMKVVQDLGGACFVHSWFEEGGDYCVPQEAATTKRIFGLLAQLIAIQTAASDLSITPIVRVIE